MDWFWGIALVVAEDFTLCGVFPVCIWCFSAWFCLCVCLSRWMFKVKCVCICEVCACRGYSGVIYLVFLQVLEPFCLLSEQENLEAEELGISQPTSSTTDLIVSQTKLNASPPPSNSSSANHKDLSCTGSLAETETVSTPLAVTSSSSVPDAESVLPPPLSDFNSVSQPCMVSVPSNTQSGVLPAEDDSYVLPQPQSEPRVSHHRQEEIRSNESNSPQIENSPPEIKVANNLFESVV